MVGVAPRAHMSSARGTVWADRGRGIIAGLADAGAHGALASVWDRGQGRSRLRRSSRPQDKVRADSMTTDTHC